MTMIVEKVCIKPFEADFLRDFMTQPSKFAFQKFCLTHILAASISEL